MHVVLLGDTVFDRDAVAPHDDGVPAALRRVLPAGAVASSLARDGARIADLPAQLARLPADVTHLVVSIGERDATEALSGLDEPATTIAAALDHLAVIRDRFAARHAAVADALAATRRPVALCTMRAPAASADGLSRARRTAVDLLDDAIARIVFTRGLALIDLRLVCPDGADFAPAGVPSPAGPRRSPPPSPASSIAPRRPRPSWSDLD